MNAKRLLFVTLGLLSLLLIDISSWCEEAYSEDSDTREMKTEQTVKEKKANGFYGEVTFIDRKSKMITINHLDISGKDVAQALDKSDHVKIKILVVYPTTKSVVAEIIDSNKMWNLENGSKKFFVTDVFEKLIKEKIFAVYGEIASIDRKFKQIVIDQLDISTKDVSEALKKVDHVKLKIVAIYPSTKSVIAETIPQNEMRYLKKGRKKFFITDAFERLTKEIEDFMSNGDKSLDQKAYKKAVDCYKQAFVKDAYNLYPLAKNKLEFAQVQLELQKLKEQLEFAEEKRQCGNEQNAVENYVKAVKLYESALQKNTKIRDDTQQKVGFAYWNLALAFSHNGTLDKATEYCKKAFMLIDSDDIGIKKQLGEDCMKYGIQRYVSADYAGARKCFEFGIELFPSNSQFRIYINFAYAETLFVEATKYGKQEMHSAALGKYNEAISIYKKLATQKEAIDIYEKIAIKKDFTCKELKEKIFLIENKLCVVRIQEKEVELKTLFAEKKRLPTDLARCREELNIVKAKEIGASSDLGIAQQKARIFYDLDYGLPLIAQEAEKIKFARERLRGMQEMERNIRRKIFNLQNAPAQNEKQIKLVENEIEILKSARSLLTPYYGISWGSTYKDTKQALEDRGYRILEENPNTQFFIYDRILGEKSRVGFLFNDTNQINSISQGHFFSDDNTKTLKKVQTLLVAQYGKKETSVQKKELSLPTVPIQMWLYEDEKPKVVILQNKKTNEVIVTYYAPSEYWMTGITVNGETRITTKGKAQKKKTIIVDLDKGIKMKLVCIAAGEFMMGSGASAEEIVRQGGGKSKYYENEHPQHKVKITKGFYMGKYEVTQDEYKAIMCNNPSYFKGANNPVEQVTWNNAVEFCQKLSQKTGKNFRLPTEAEWEYACRAGTSTAFHYGNSLSSDHANFDGRYPYGDTSKGVYRAKTTPVGNFKPNAWGLYDMHGNVFEWCNDRYDKDYYKNIPHEDPKGPDSGNSRVLRGGCLSYLAADCRSAARYKDFPDLKKGAIMFHHGFRCVQDEIKRIQRPASTGKRAPALSKY